MLRRAVLAMLGILLIGGLIAQGVEELAELHVTTITLDPPSSVTRGIEIEIRARVMNTGQRNADPVDVGFFYRPMGGSSSWMLVSTVSDASLAPSQEDYLEVAFSLSTIDLELGSYEIRIVADPLNQITEIDELNNELITSFLLVESTLGLADLQPISLSYSPTNPESSDDMLPWNVSTTIENQTSTQAGAFTVAFLIDGVEFDRQFLFALPANSTVDVLGEFDPFLLGLTAGTYTIRVVVDPDEQVYEMDEANNSISSALTLLSPDLYPTRLAFDKSAVRMDEEMRITADIVNGGEGTAKNIDVGFYLDHVRFAVVQVPVLGRGLSATVEAILSPDDVGLHALPQVHEIEIIIDPNDNIPELDEANNTMARALTILEPGVRKPELHPESIEIGPASPVELGRTDTVTVSATVRNTGRASAQDFDVTFFYRVKGGLRWEAFPCSGDAGCANVDLASGIQTKLTGILPVLLLPPGIYEVRVLVDSGSVVSELDEANNEMITTLTLLAARLPDLVFSLTQPIGIEPSTQVHRGQTIRFTPTITNVGDLDAGDFFVRFSYQNVSEAAQAQQTGQAPEYRTAFFSPSANMQVRALAIGETAEIPVLLETRDLSPGQYSVQMEIDPPTGPNDGGSIIERNESNNVFSTLVSILGPDLAPVDLYTIPGGLVDQSQTDSVDVVSTILNSGVSPAGEFTVKFQLLHIDESGIAPIRVYSCGDAEADCGAPEFFGEVTLPGIGILVPEQARCTLDLSSVDLEPGEYVIRVLTDCQGGLALDGSCIGQVAEHNELNNVLEIPLVITGRRAVDLTLADLQVSANADDPTLLDVRTTVSNLGIKAADAFEVVLRIMDVPEECDALACGTLTQLLSLEVPGLGGHAEYDLGWTLNPATFGPVQGNLILQADADCASLDGSICVSSIEESDETNNSSNRVDLDIEGSGHAPVVGGTDLSIRSFHAVQQIEDPNRSQAWATIVNQGEEDTDPFYVTFYYINGAGTRVVLPRIRVGALLAGTDRSVLQVFDTASLGTGYHVVGIEIDVDNVVPETDEANNARETDLLIR